MGLSRSASVVIAYLMTKHNMSLDRALDFIDRAVTGGGLVVVNCYMGLSRSASVVIAYLMTKHNMSLDRALDFVKKSRNVRPNEGFQRQLRDLEFSLKRRR